MTRDEAIKDIEQLYPADSDYPNVRAKGEMLLDQAKRNTENWRYLPDPVLFEYARLCREEENRQYLKSFKEM